MKSLQESSFIFLTAGLSVILEKEWFSTLAEVFSAVYIDAIKRFN